MKLKDLIGYQIVDLNDYEMTVSKGSDTFAILFDNYKGDCCGFADIGNKLLVDLENTKVNPVITNVEYDKNTEYGEQNVKITLFGECKLIAEIEARAGSGSGWMYGATVTAICKPLDIDEEIAAW